MNKLLENKKDTVGDLLRFQRKLKRLSQLELALDVDISSKHLSFVETGKSKPSRSLILKIAQALKLSLRHRNALLKAAGYAPEFTEEPINSYKMEMVRLALKRMLTQHEPYPAIVLNAGYGILMKNSGFDRIIKHYLGEEGLKKYDNIYRMVFAKDGLRQYINDWPVVAQFMTARLWEESVATQNEELIALFKEISQLNADKEPFSLQVDGTLPILNMKLEKDGVKASFFSMITTFGTPLDLTTQELRIESIFPADERTKQLFAVAG